MGVSRWTLLHGHNRVKCVSLLSRLSRVVCFSCLYVSACGVVYTVTWRQAASRPILASLVPFLPTRPLSNGWPHMPHCNCFSHCQTLAVPLPHSAHWPGRWRYHCAPKHRNIQYTERLGLQSQSTSYRVLYRAVSITPRGLGTVGFNVLALAWHTCILLDGALLRATWVCTIHYNTASFLLHSELYSFVLNCGFCVCHLIYLDWFWYFGNVTFCVYFVHIILPAEDAT
jgi:hypothetical protein